MRYLIHKSLLLLFLLLAIPQAGTSLAQAQNSRSEILDTLEASLITCSPGDKIYELYGHTAIRIHNSSNKEDWVFNFGMFSFNSPHFIWRFLRGQTDYYLAAYPFPEFVHEYIARGSSLTEQVLNLTSNETHNLLMALSKLALREDWTYRYNFLYDNCTTRARDQIEQAIIGKVVYPTEPVQNGEISYRKIIHQYTTKHPWDEFGQDLLLGSQADRPISLHQQQFAPLYMRDFADKAYIVSGNGAKRPLVKQTIDIPTQKSVSETLFSYSRLLSPTAVCSIVFLLTLLIVFHEIRHKKICLAYDILLTALQGLSGCIIFLMVCFSTHPTVQSNWLIIWLNPIPLLYLPRRIYLLLHKRKDLYSPIAALIMALFLVCAPFIPQYFSPGILILALTLLIQLSACTYVQMKVVSNE